MKAVNANTPSLDGNLEMDVGRLEGRFLLAPPGKDIIVLMQLCEHWFSTYCVQSTSPDVWEQKSSGTGSGTAVRSASSQPEERKACTAPLQTRRKSHCLGRQEGFGKHAALSYSREDGLCTASRVQGWKWEAQRGWRQEAWGPRQPLHVKGARLWCSVSQCAGCGSWNQFSGSRSIFKWNILE